MAIASYVLTCDHCTEVADEFESDAEATQFGWYFVLGPERDLGGTGEQAFCSRDCMIDAL